MTATTTTGAPSAVNSASSLRMFHFQLVELMDRIDRIAESPDLDDMELSNARWKLSTARRESRLLVDALLHRLSSSADEPLTSALAELRAQATQALQATARHSVRWNVKAVRQDRLGYRHAIRQLRDQWMATIDAEQRILYPILGLDGGRLDQVSADVSSADTRRAAV